jgi:GT2 family glycosyltransferase
MTQDAELVTVVILNLNKKDDTLKCLDSVFKSDYHPIEVVLVDNGSTDGSVEAVSKAFSEVDLVKSSTNLGASGGRNLGIEYANEKFDYSYILFLDNDSIVEDTTLKKLVESLKGDRNAGVAYPKAYGTLHFSKIMSVGINVSLYTGSIYDIGAGEIDQGQYNQPGYAPACGGFAFLCKREVLSQIGWFDEVFNPYGWEEVDFSLRVRKGGFKILYVPKAVVCHKGGRVGRGCRLPEYEKYKFRNFLILMTKHANLLQWICFVCLVPLKAISLVIDGVYRGDTKVLLAQFRGFLEGCSSNFDSFVNRRKPK